jgi:hypothetical protein
MAAKCNHSQPRARIESSWLIKELSKKKISTISKETFFWELKIADLFKMA